MHSTKFFFFKKLFFRKNGVLSTFSKHLKSPPFFKNRTHHCMDFFLKKENITGPAQQNGSLNFFFTLKWLTIILSCCFLATPLFSQDLPPNTIANIQTIGTGSYIIPLDAEKQSVEQINDILFIDFVGFNVAAYGLVYQILDAGIPVKWVIRTGKNKDEADFTAEAWQLFPAEFPPDVYDFRSSAFVIDIEDLTTEVCGTTGNLIDLLNGVITNFGHQVAVYYLETDTDMDVRYTLTYAPRVAVLNDGFSAYVHENLFEQADIPYVSLSSNAFFANSVCYSFICQPHLDFIDNPNYIPTLADFINNGGNFLAQCIAIEQFENGGLFQTTNGVDNLNFNNISYNYFFPDMAIMQFEGELSADIHGSLDEFGLSNGSTWLPNTFVGITNQNDDIILSVADANGTTLGGNITYISGHDYEGTDLADIWGTPPPNIVEELVMNQEFKKTFLNAAFIPANIGFACAGNDICICAGESVTLGCEDLALDGEYIWTPSTGLNCDDCPHPIASPSVTTTYTISTLNGCNTSAITIEVQTDIVSAFLSGDGVLPCEAGAITYLEVTFSEGENWTFDYALDGVYVGTISTNENPYILSVSEIGEYTLLSVFSDDNGCNNMVSGSATVVQGVPFDIDLGEDTLLCDGENLLLDATVSPTATYEWQDYSTEATLLVIAPGTYWVAVTDNDCVAYDTITIAYTPSLPPLNLGDDQLNCNEVSLILDATLSADMVAYEWQDGSTNPVFTATEPGIYWVEVSNECEALIDTVLIELIPELSISPIPDQQLCAGESLTLTATAQNATSYEWSNGATDTTITVNESGLYWFQVSNECTVLIDTILINNIPEIPAIDLGNDLIFCNNEAINITVDATTPNATTYQWSNGGNEAILNISEPGTYAVTAINECFVQMDEITIQSLPPLPILELGSDRTICKEPSIIIDATLNGATDYLWSNGSTNPVVTITETGIYWVEVGNDCEVQQDEITITFEGTANIEPFIVPNAFSPNEDGVNDCFLPIPIAGIELSSFEFQVYNRWGEQIFITYQTGECWEGVHRLQAAEIGVYVWFYIAQVRDCDGSLQAVFRKGNVSLIR